MQRWDVSSQTLERNNASKAWNVWISLKDRCHKYRIVQQFSRAMHHSICSYCWFWRPVSRREIKIMKRFSCSSKVAFSSVIGICPECCIRIVFGPVLLTVSYINTLITTHYGSWVTPKVNLILHKTTSCIFLQTSMSVSRLLVLKVRPVWMRSMATAASVRQDTLDLAVKNVSAEWTG